MLEKNISIIIPCFNESKNLEKLVNRIKIDLKKVDYFVDHDFLLHLKRLTHETV